MVALQDKVRATRDVQGDRVELTRFLDNEDSVELMAEVFSAYGWRIEYMGRSEVTTGFVIRVSIPCY